jgi:hypothetical protein
MGGIFRVGCTEWHEFSQGLVGERGGWGKLPGETINGDSTLVCANFEVGNIIKKLS